MIHIGDWVRFYLDGRLVIGIVEYLRKSPDGLHGPEVCTDHGMTSRSRIIEARRPRRAESAAPVERLVLETMREHKIAFASRMLAHCAGNKREACRVLDISHHTLMSYLRASSPSDNEGAAMSPDAPLRPCAGGCGTLVRRGRCPACAPAADRRRGTAHQRGYDRAWLVFREAWINELVCLHGELPVCGAAFPDGPTQRESACRDADLLTFTSADGSSLHLDHTPALEDWERRDQRAVCDPLRIVLKCAACHNAKTAKEQRRQVGGGL